MTTAPWSVRTDLGSSLSADEFVGVLSTHHARLIDAWQSLSPAQWDQRSRNVDWSVHDTARHVADCLELSTPDASGERGRVSLDGFDPRTTPERWLAQSAGDPPERTVERFAVAAHRYRAGVAERLAAGDQSTTATVYGSDAHWTVSAVHLFWDSWLHERDMFLPLGLPAESTVGEQRLAALYGLLMATVPAKMLDQSFAVTVDFDGPGGQVVTAAHESGRFSSAETTDATTDLVGDRSPLIDALSGRGAPINTLLPDAPDMLGVFADFMAG